MRFTPGCSCCGGCRVLRVTVRGCGPVETGGTPNPTVWAVPGALVEVRQGGTLVGSGTADASGVVEIEVSTTGTYAVSGVDPHGTLAGSLSVAVSSCSAVAQSVALDLVAVAGYHCLRGVLYRALEDSIVLTDSQGTRTVLNGADLRGQAGNDTSRWESCQVVSTTHKFFGPFTGQVEDCENVGTGDVRVLYEFSSRFDPGTGTWRPTITQVWKALACVTPDIYPIYEGGTCPPTLPTSLGDFTATGTQFATTWSAGPPFTASFTFPTTVLTLGSTTQYMWYPMPGTITVSET